MLLRHKKGESPVRARLQSADDKDSKKSASKSFATLWNGWLLTLFVVMLVVAFALPKLKAGMMDTASYSTAIKTTESAAVSATTEEESTAASDTTTSTTTNKQQQQQTAIISIPECESSPWKPDEDLVGTCPGNLKTKPDITNAIDCAASCCASEECVAFQFRADKGCLQGKDVRIGQEKDGPAAYCSDHPPLRWQGQLLKDTGKKEAECTIDTWHPDEQQGQCFGLGDTRQGTFATAEDCMKACCADEKCRAWQFQETLGCFYNAGMHGCQRSDDPIVFEPYVGRRKLVSTRTYTGKRGEPAKNWKRSTSD
jgi:hypothetical protein